MRRRRRHPETGQSLVEFALVLMPLFVILLGIIQFGFIFNAYVTITNATREGARNGTVYIYDAGLSKAQNDLARNEFIKTSLLASMNLLTKTSPNFATGSTWSQSGNTFTNGDLVVTYALPVGHDRHGCPGRLPDHGPGHVPPGPRGPADPAAPAEGHERAPGTDLRSHDGAELMARGRRRAAGSTGPGAGPRSPCRWW